MQVSNPNNVNIYNLSIGKSLPEWLSERKRREKVKKNPDLRRRIILIQNFEMPTVSHCVDISRDGQHIIVTGSYKPRVRCYDVNHLSLKFERCLDFEVIKFKILSEDYSKMVFLQSDRFVEFHNQAGFYYKLRIPKFGRDFAYHYPSCDLYFVGASPEIFRFNLEQGRFLNSFVSSSYEINVCEVNPVHHLFSCGTAEGKVECWDPRARHRVGILDCVLNSFQIDSNVLPEISCLKYRDGLQMAVGTSTGQVLLYDIRSDKPVLTKDHHYGLPIKDIEFCDAMDIVLSMDTKCLKLWERNSGKPYTAIESISDLNDLCLVPNSGLLFMACETSRLLTYFIPSLGPAPKWCSFLDNLTEELEENPQAQVYDDYKFITRQELEDLNLSDLLGTKMLRAYMHGYFLNINLYHKAKSLVEPLVYENYKKKKIKQKLEETHKNRVKIQQLPKVNKDLALKLMDQEDTDDITIRRKKTSGVIPNLLKDDRFKALFENPDFHIDVECDEYKLAQPLVTTLEKKNRKKMERLKEQFQEIEEDPQQQGNTDEDFDSSSSSDDEHTWNKQMKREYRLLKRDPRTINQVLDEKAVLTPKYYELKDGEEFSKLPSTKNTHLSRTSLGERLLKLSNVNVKETSVGSKEMSFTLSKPKSNKETRQQKAFQHHKERRKIRRSAFEIEKEFKSKDPRFWKKK